MKECETLVFWSVCFCCSDIDLVFQTFSFFVFLWVFFHRIYIIPFTAKLFPRSFQAQRQWFLSWRIRGKVFIVIVQGYALGCPPRPVTARIIIFLVGDPYTAMQFFLTVSEGINMVNEYCWCTKITFQLSHRPLGGMTLEKKHTFPGKK